MGKIADTDTLWLSVKTSISSCFMTEKAKLAPIRANQRGFATVSDLLRRGLYPLHSRGRLPLDDIFPEKLRNEEQRRIIQSHSEEENPILIKYVFKMKINENLIYIFLLGILAGIICVRCESLKKSPKDMYIDNFEYEKESLYIYKRKN